MLQFRLHGGRLVWPVLMLIVIAGLAGYWVGALPELWMNLAALAAAILLALLMGVLPILSWLATRTTVTTSRVIVRTGLVSRHRSEVPLDRVREVRTKQGAGQRMRGSGDIVLLVGADGTVLRDVAGVHAVADALQELVQRNFAAAVGGGGGPRATGAPFASDPAADPHEGVTRSFFD